MVGHCLAAMAASTHAELARGAGVATEDHSGLGLAVASLGWWLWLGLPGVRRSSAGRTLGSILKVHLWIPLVSFARVMVMDVRRLAKVDVLQSSIA